jgi:large subunit ribosomal protein L25
METINLEAKARAERGRKTNKGRKEGMIPAVVYGRSISSEMIWVNNLDFKRLLKKSGESTLIDLSIDSKVSHKVLIYDTQKDPVDGKFLHVDFFQVNMAEKIETDVELVFVGEAPAVKELGGVFVKNMDEVEVSCLPADLPSEITVDISALKTFEDRIIVKDLKLGKGVEIKLDEETVIALVAPPRGDEELSALNEKVEADVSKVVGVVKEEAPKSEEEKKK